MRQQQSLVDCEIQLGIHVGGQGSTAHWQKVMETLNDYGNKLMAKKMYAEAAFAYMLGACKLESGGVDDTNEVLRGLAAKCHCNLSQAKLKLAELSDRSALEDAARAASAAISLKPGWEKPH